MANRGGTPDLFPDGAPEPPRKRSFAPVVDAHVRVLVLGSLPGERSLAQGRYYAHPLNKAWELLGALIGIDLRAMPYEARTATLLEHGIGLWDVISEAERPGSLDSHIRNHVSNDLLTLIESLPHLAMIAFNGGTASRLGRKQLRSCGNRWRLLDLPSSSPAHTLPYAEKLARWILLREALT